MYFFSSHIPVFDTKLLFCLACRKLGTREGASAIRMYEYADAQWRTLK